MRRTIAARPPATSNACSTVTNGVEEIVKLVGVQEIPSADALRIFPGYLDAVERLTKYVDGWSQAK